MRSLMAKFGWDVPYIPMNVNNSGDRVEALFGNPTYIAELKRDGNRFTSIDGRIFSRKKSENKKTPELLGLPVEKTANVPHLHAFFKNYPGLVVEGEIYYPKKKSNHVTSIMGCDSLKAQMRQGFGHFGCDDKGIAIWSDTEPGDWLGEVRKLDKDFAKFTDNGPIHYMLFEMTYLSGRDLRDLSWRMRRAFLKSWYDMEVKGTEHAEYIHLSEVYEGEQDKRMLLEWAELNGEEGIVFKNANSLYQCDKRPQHHWYRVKGKITADVVVMGYEPSEVVYEGDELETWQYWEDADGNKFMANGSAEAIIKRWDSAAITKGHFYGWIGSVVFGLYKNGVLTKAGSCSGMNEEMRAEFTRSQDQYLGKVIEVTAMERTEKGLFRHPQYSRLRSDKNAEECTWEYELDA